MSEILLVLLQDSKYENENRRLSLLLLFEQVLLKFLVPQ